MPIKYIVYSEIRVIFLVNLSVIGIIQLNALGIANVGKPSIKSNIIKYLNILIVLIKCKFFQDL